MSVYNKGGSKKCSAQQQLVKRIIHKNRWIAIKLEVDNRRNRIAKKH